MKKTKPAEKTVLCADCKKHKATIRFSAEPVFAVTHGFGITMICLCCYLRRIEREYKKIAKHRKTVIDELVKKGCG